MDNRVFDLENAIKNNDLEKVIKWLDNGVDPNSVGQFGYTMLYSASRYGYVDIMATLIQRGANPNIGNVEKPLHGAVRVENVDAVKLLLEVVDDVNVRNIVGETSLHLCTDYNQLGITELLLSHGADIESIDNLGRHTPFYNAMIKVKGAKRFKSKK